MLAGLIVGTYPPLIGATGDQLSEPLGAFLLIAAFTALALALKRRARTVALRGGRARCSGSTILTRTDLLPVPFLIAGLGGADRAAVAAALAAAALLTWGMLAVAAGVVLAPWTIYASARGGPLHPGHQGQRGGAVRRHLPARRRHDDRA